MGIKETPCNVILAYLRQKYLIAEEYCYNVCCRVVHLVSLNPLKMHFIVIELLHYTLAYLFPIQEIKKTE